MTKKTICDVKQVLELYNDVETNKYLNNGWVLLSVGFECDGVRSSKRYILGFHEPKPQDTDFAPVVEFRNSE